MVEILSARKYYGRHAVGVVVLVNGRPHHFTGKDARKQANTFARQRPTGQKGNA